MALPKLRSIRDLAEALGSESSADAVVAVFENPESLPTKLSLIAQNAARVDATIGEGTTMLVTPDLPGGRFVLAATGPLNRDQDDVRRIADAAAAGLRRAQAAGAKSPVLLFGDCANSETFTRALDVGLLGALGAIWQPLEAREALGESVCEPLTEITYVVPEGVDGARTTRWVTALEQGRRLSRDIGGTEPERMSPIKMAEYCEKAFEGTPVQVEIVSDLELMRSEYPMLMAVARASLAVERHHPRVIRLCYEPEGPVTETLYFAGKGLSYDTGGADLKAGGHMAGMSRDKGGAASVAGIFLTAAHLRPRNIRLVAEIGAVRNSVGPDSFVSDEIIVSHAGTRVRVGNTDAEGRLVLGDLLSHLRVQALETENAGTPHLFSMATLTGHAGRAMGPYTIALDNGPARAKDTTVRLSKMGDLWGDPVEISRLRREDFDFVRPRTKADDTLSCNNASSTMTARGHQFPMAFLMRASGIEKHGSASEKPLAYTHVDTGGSFVEGSDWQHGRPTGTPVVVFAANWFLKNL